jgi:AcrR family transcriptional regulator
MAKLPVKRPGGRSSRITQAVFEAVESLLAETPSEIPSMAAIAQRADVNPTTLYRRWSDARELVGAVAVSRLMRDNPVVDTGSVRGDLIRWGNSVARSLSTRRNIALLRILTATPTAGAGISDMRGLRELPIGRRVVELETLLARGKKRRELTPKVMDVLELVLAPIYLHGLFLGPLRDASVDRLVDRALALAGTPLAPLIG